MDNLGKQLIKSISFEVNGVCMQKYVKCEKCMELFEVDCDSNEWLKLKFCRDCDRKRNISQIEPPVLPFYYNINSVQEKYIGCNSCGKIFIWPDDRDFFPFCHDCYIKLGEEREPKRMKIEYKNDGFLIIGGGMMKRCPVIEEGEQKRPEG